MTATLARQKRAVLIREFLCRQSAEPGFVRKRFQELFHLSSSHLSAVEQFRLSRPGTPNPAIKDTREKAFQRALFGQGTTTISLPDGETQMHWLDYELPVVPGMGARRHACDLIARFRGHETICEVKYAPPPNGCGTRDQEYAIFELLFQLQAVALNSHLSVDIHHLGEQFRTFSWNEVATAETAFILGNRSWWRGSSSIPAERLRRLVSQIREEIGLQVVLLQSEDVAFPPTEAPYVPIWPHGVATKLEAVFG